MCSVNTDKKIKKKKESKGTILFYLAISEDHMHLLDQNIPKL